jgi:TolB-like protein
VNLGDIIVEGSDIYGDGVNVAARLEGLAEPGGICISGKVYEEVRNKLPTAFEDLGEREIKNISEPVRVYRWTDAIVDPMPGMAGADEPLPLPDKPSIAVLPFDNMSGDPEQEYFADGIAEDIITRLSHVRGFFVIARNSSFTYKGRSIDVKEVARDLGVNYVLEGSVRKAGDRVRISAQLIDATTGNHVWADRYDRNLEDIFAVQDEITDTVVATIEPQLYAAEGERSRRKAPDNLSAWDLVMRALPHFWKYTEGGDGEALTLLAEAMALDPEYAKARSLSALVRMHIVWMGWSDTPAEALRLVSETARAAVQLDEQDPWAHLALGQTYSYARNPEDAVAAIRKAIDLNPSFAMAHAWLGIVLGYAGMPEGAIGEIDQAVRISPLDPFNTIYPTFRSVVHFAAGRYEETLAETRQSVRERPEFIGAWRMLVISLAHLGRIEEARNALVEAKRLQPGLSLAWAQEFAPWAREDDLNRYVEGFRLAGLLE